MKKYILSLVVMMLTGFTSANAMSFEQAREQALFLTDKMAYELNLTESQYEAAYEINLDYLMSVNTYDDVYADCWTRRNLDLSYILFDWQYTAFCAATYFYRPLWWEGGVWHFGIYARYPHRNYFYFGRPHFYATYHGGHSWRINGGRSWYHGNFVRHNTEHHVGMRDNMGRGGRPGVNNHNNGPQMSRSGRTNTQRNNVTPQRGNAGSHGSTATPQRNNAGPRNNTVAPQRSGNSNSTPRQSSTRTTVTRPSTPSHSSAPSVSRSSSSFGGGSSHMGGGSSRGGASMGGSRGSGSHGGRR